MKPRLCTDDTPAVFQDDVVEAGAARRSEDPLSAKDFQVPLVAQLGDGAVVN